MIVGLITGWIGANVGPWDTIIVGLNVAQVVALAVIASRSRRVRHDDDASSTSSSSSSTRPDG